VSAVAARAPRLCPGRGSSAAAPTPRGTELRFCSAAEGLSPEIYFPFRWRSWCPRQRKDVPDEAEAQDDRGEEGASKPVSVDPSGRHLPRVEQPMRRGPTIKAQPSRLPFNRDPDFFSLQRFAAPTELLLFQLCGVPAAVSILRTTASPLLPAPRGSPGGAAPSASQQQPAALPSPGRDPLR